METYLNVVFLVRTLQNPVAVTSLSFFPHRTDRIIVIDRSNTIRVIDLSGALIHSFLSTSSNVAPTTPAPKKESKSKSKDPVNLSDFISVTVSPKGKYLYGVTEECVMHTYEVETGKLEGVVKVFH